MSVGVHDCHAQLAPVPVNSFAGVMAESVTFAVTTELFVLSLPSLIFIPSIVTPFAAVNSAIESTEIEVLDIEPPVMAGLVIVLFVSVWAVVRSARVLEALGSV